MTSAAKILVYTETVTWRGGDAAVMLRMCRDLARTYDVTLCFPLPAPTDMDLQRVLSSEIHLAALPMSTALHLRTRLGKGLRWRAIFAGYECLRLLLFVWNAWCLWRHFRRLRPAHVIACNGGWPGADSPRAALLAAWLAKVPDRILIWHSSLQPSSRLQRPVEWLLRGCTVRSATTLATANAKAAELLLARRFLSPAMAARKVRSFTYGIEDFTPCPRETTEATKVCRIVFAGRFSYEKAPDIAAEVARALASMPCEFHFIGDGPMWQETRRQMADYPHAYFHGFVADWPVRMGQFDVLLVPSRTECMPLVILEAMASRLPVVAADLGAIAQVVHHGESGIVIASPTVAKYVEALQELIASPALRQQLGAAGRRRFESHYTIAAMMTSLRALLEPAP